MQHKCCQRQFKPPEPSVLKSEEQSHLLSDGPYHKISFRDKRNTNTVEFEWTEGRDLLEIKCFLSLSIQVKIKRGQERATDLPAWVCTSKQDAKRKQRTYKEWKKGLISKELSLRGQTVEMKLKLPGGQENGISQRKLKTNKRFLDRKE